MRNKTKNSIVRRSVFLLVLTAVVMMLPGELSAQTTATASSGSFPVFNPPPCDFTDDFLKANGFDVPSLNTTGAARFGNLRQTGPPAFLAGQVNWVNDSSCNVNDPTRRNVRI